MSWKGGLRTGTVSRPFKSSQSLSTMLVLGLVNCNYIMNFAVVHLHHIAGIESASIAPSFWDPSSIATTRCGTASNTVFVGSNHQQVVLEPSLTFYIYNIHHHHHYHHDGRSIQVEERQARRKGKAGL
jgi:hypothetical protein